MQLQSTVRLAQEQHISTTTVLQRIAIAHPSWNYRARWQLFQKTAYASLLQKQCVDAEHRIRCKLDRWKLPDPAGRVARRALSRLLLAFTLVAPRVAVVLFRTLWNGWCTARRFQEVGTCVFGCPGLAQDSIEHHSRCPHQRNFASEVFYIPVEQTGNQYSRREYRGQRWSP